MEDLLFAGIVILEGDAFHERVFMLLSGAEFYLEAGFRPMWISTWAFCGFVVRWS